MPRRVAGHLATSCWGEGPGLPGTPSAREMEQGPRQRKDHECAGKHPRERQPECPPAAQPRSQLTCAWYADAVLKPAQQVSGWHYGSQRAAQPLFKVVQFVVIVAVSHSCTHCTRA